MKLFLARLESDWDRLPDGIKKPWGWREAMAVHSSCGGFLAIMQALRGAIPQADYVQHEKQIRDQFQLSYLDPDIIHFLENAVPPVDLQEVNFVRTDLLKTPIF